MSMILKTMMFMIFVIPAFTACSNEEASAPTTQAESTFDNATFDTSTWK